MSSTAATTATGTASAPSATNTCAGPSLYNIPVSDAACAIASGGNHTDTMSECCKGADVVSYNGDCGLYCLAMGQTVEDLTNCLYGNGIAWQDAFCNGTGNATATATENARPTASGATVVSGGDGERASSTGDGASSSSTGGSESGAAASARGVSAVGVTISGLLLSSIVLGFIQL